MEWKLAPGNIRGQRPRSTPRSGQTARRIQTGTAQQPGASYRAGWPKLATTATRSGYVQTRDGVIALPWHIRRLRLTRGWAGWNGGYYWRTPVYSATAYATGAVPGGLSFRAHPGTRQVQREGSRASSDLRQRGRGTGSHCCCTVR